MWEVTLYLVTKLIFCDSDTEEYDEDSFEFRELLEFKVFSLGCIDSSDGEGNYFWEAVTSLGDRVFFVSDFVTFSVSAQVSRTWLGSWQLHIFHPARIYGASVFNV